MKTKEELNALKDEVKAMNMKLAELSEEELEQVSGGVIPRYKDGMFPILLCTGSTLGFLNPAGAEAIGGQMTQNGKEPKSGERSEN